MKKALVVVDFQNDFVSGSLGFPGAEKLTEKINARISEALDNNIDVLFTLDTHFDNYLSTREGKYLPTIHCIKGTLGHEIVESTAKFLPRAKKIFEKPTFGSVELAEFLKKENYQSIEFIGLVSNICVLSNAVLAKAFLPESDIKVDASCTASFSNDLNNKAMDILEGIQIDVVGRK